MNTIVNYQFIILQSLTCSKQNKKIKVSAIFPAKNKIKKYI